MRIATFNIENLDDSPVDPDEDPPFEVRAAILRPMLERLRADIICFQEIHGQRDGEDAPRRLRALERLLDGTRYAGFEPSSTRTQAGQIEAERNLVVASHPDWAVEEAREIQNTLVNPPEYSRVTAEGDQDPMRVRWDLVAAGCGMTVLSSALRNRSAGVENSLTRKAALVKALL
ncbi:hypothetical protein OCH239_09815 [Roseivivax halodurans JCM 10272]|uniref:Endonuclease/exonuclease/phosphatase domain-containing protein n=1 Tax=Roseivivax halodurans JCM 10272 TaxID=1449350 RepID=X7EEC6_9RHOB|nr:hypothetical protein [Roseivivax halodurans]ETX13566.1 hypothetical protein OCH239_09815 [Roseivivax halodurans JCM 10272]